jgi:hypothetical protein
MVRTALNCLRVGGWILVVSARFETVSHSLKQLRTVSRSHTVANNCERFETVASSCVQSGSRQRRTAQELGRPAGPDRAKTAVALGGGSRSGAKLAETPPPAWRHGGRRVWRHPAGTRARPCRARRGGSGSPGAAGCKAAAGGARDGATEHGQRRAVRSVALPLCRSVALPLCRSVASPPLSRPPPRPGP